MLAMRYLLLGWMCVRLDGKVGISGGYCAYWGEIKKMVNERNKTFCDADGFTNPSSYLHPQVYTGTAACSEQPPMFERGHNIFE